MPYPVDHETAPPTGTNNALASALRVTFGKQMRFLPAAFAFFACGCSGIRVINPVPEQSVVGGYECQSEHMVYDLILRADHTYQNDRESHADNFSPEEPLGTLLGRWHEKGIWSLQGNALTFSRQETDDPYPRLPVVLMVARVKRDWILIPADSYARRPKRIPKPLINLYFVKSNYVKEEAQPNKPVTAQRP